MISTVAHSILVVAVMLSATAWAVSPLAPEQADRAAKQAAPPPDRALLYVFIVDADKPPAVWLDGREAGSLGANTFMLLSVAPGRHELRQGPGGVGIAITVDAARAYFVQQTGTGLRWVPDTQGRPAVQQSHLINDQLGFARALSVEPPRTIAPAAPAPKPVPKAQPPTPTAPPVAKPTPEKVSPPAPAPVAKATAGELQHGSALILKTGAFRLSKESQVFIGNQASYDSSASGVFAIEYEWHIPSGVAFGAEFIRYNIDLNIPALSARGEASATVGLVNVKKYFPTGTRWHPYVGAGIGFAKSDLSGDTIGSGNGFAYQAMAGIDMRWNKVGLYGEFKFLSADTDDDAGTHVDVSGNGVFVGISFSF